METIKSIEEVHEFKISAIAPLNGETARLGLGSMINALGGFQTMEGYVITTDAHVYRVLVDDQASCCEQWGYISSDDDLPRFIGAELLSAEATDTAINKKYLVDVVGGKLDWNPDLKSYRDTDDPNFEDGGVQFVDFKTDRGTFQLAVYNAHNGYYGHGIIFAKDDEVLLNGVV